jgi:hypothetical protein
MIKRSTRTNQELRLARRSEISQYLSPYRSSEVLSIFEPFPISHTPTDAVDITQPVISHMNRPSLTIVPHPCLVVSPGVRIAVGSASSTAHAVSPRPRSRGLLCRRRLPAPNARAIVNCSVAANDNLEAAKVLDCLRGEDPVRRCCATAVAGDGTAGGIADLKPTRFGRDARPEVV